MLFRSVFSSAPSAGWGFFGIILAGADYVNVGVKYPDGSLAAPSITFDNDLDTGFYSYGANQIGVSCGGTISTVFTANGYGFKAGTNTAPGLFVDGDTNTGLYSPGADQLSITTGGTARVTVSGTALTSALPVDVPLGTNSAPGLTFTGDLNTGVYSPGADQLAITTGGTARLTVNTTSITSTLPVLAPLGSVSAPSYTFTGDTNTGIYSPGADQLAITAGGSDRINVDSSGRVGIGISSPAANSKLDLNGSYVGNVTAVAALDIDCSSGNYFTKTISSTSSFTFSNVPSSRAYSFTLEVTHTSGTISWPAEVKWPSDTAPTLTTGKTHVFIFVTDDGGSRWRGAALVDYVN